MIVSKIRNTDGVKTFFEIDTSIPECWEILMFSQKADFNTFESDFWESIDCVSLKNGCPFYSDRCTTNKLSCNYGENANLLKLSDLRQIKEEMLNVVNWVLDRKGVVEFRPVDERRYNATLRLLRGIKGYITPWHGEDEDGDVIFKITINKYL